MRKIEIWMVTKNENKIREARDILYRYGIKLLQLKKDRVEIQADNLKEIAIYSLNAVNESIPLAVEDAGLFIDSLKGFPGPYSAYTLKKLGNPGILKLMNGLETRTARYISAIAYRDERGIRAFQGITEGKIAQTIRGNKGFGYDPIFIPDEGDDRTFGEMSKEEKNKISHRAKAFHALGNWLSHD